jgi:uncharacterized protein YkwD
MVRILKLPRLLSASALGFLLSCIGTMLPESDVHQIAAPDLSRPLVETYPPPSAPRDPVKLALFTRINRDRVAGGLAPVLWDEAASRVSDTYCAQQVREKSRGHFLMDGLPPYARMALAGVFGMGAENSASWKTTGTWAGESLENIGLTGHERMMAERPPQDGHRRTILDPSATHVGVGYAVRGGLFQMSQEFLVRGLERLALSRGSSRLPLLKVEGIVLPPGRIHFVAIAREPRPEPLTQAGANATTSYSYPLADEAYVPEGYNSRQVTGALTLDRIRLHKDRGFSFVYLPSQPGLYTFIFYVIQEGRKPMQGGSATVLFE